MIIRKFFQHQTDDYYFEGCDYYQQQNNDKSIEYLKKALEIDPNFYLAYDKLGLVKKEKKMFNDSIFHYKKALELNPTFCSAIETIETVMKMHLDKKMIKEAKEFSEQVPKNLDAYYKLAKVYLVQNMFDESIVYYRKVLELDSNYIDAYIQLGNAYSEKLLYDQAIECYQKIIEIDQKKSVAYNNIGLIYLRQNMLDEALEQFNKAIEADPEYESSIQNSGLVYEKKDQKDKALECNNRALEINPAHKNTLSRINGLKNKNGKQAQETHKEEQQEKNLQTAKDYYEEGNKYYTELNDDESIKCLKKVIELDPNYSNAYDKLGFILKANRKYEEANYKKLQKQILSALLLWKK
ncbi:SLEI family protein (macronuclear) [Tetrahymena thermophila SB210]|uniref:SLEI family protein n=1 Tax=Tetrahymena thermophila (strain SB210) TaxID=312017 RepID=W7XG61_TETTS|nr:SLEI family protein [Tetrahymena thermophila SB210]EWS75903.1 SLEI family protein [Tetrahymena thermophila SB210]|eukprot:XP_012651574.1 SLEI family protein [Tetrahymena thermophila SB210]